MKKFCLLLFSSTLFLSSFAQIPLTVAPSGGNKKASVSERIGLTDVTIHYDRPAVKGREGKVWGELVPVGFTDPGFGSSKSAPWRAGANENTTIEFSTDVTVEGKPVKAGRYGLFLAYDPNGSTLILSNNSTSWGHYYYNAKEDALRVPLKAVASDKSVEWLKYEFLNESEAGATVALQWEKLMFPFRIETDYVKEQIASFRRELRTEKGFIWQSWNQAASWCLQRNTNLEEALLWADSATSRGFGGDRVFGAWAVKAQLLEKFGRANDAAAVMKQAMTFGNMQDLHQYGRQLLQLKKVKEALDVFKQNHDKNPNQFTTLMGLVRGYSANADYKNALKYANLALPLAPDQPNKNNVQTMINKLKEGKDVN
ncbi:DUF2911 domain-containing protein [Lacibacter sediminis]|uniref:DUF2911 domain-containing protein n=1 Tax=Lacibacter sediminis TaxID=2760713 RepID=A0A7G5XKX9_9BACT|nr:DUF2911 domain-containing protein [Lacibacter sediminis]QNA46132.1 DUF2911 domain-containing protein [Lacibacter sediminis]